MTKFKVGDRVKPSAEYTHADQREWDGGEVVAVDIYGTWPIDVKSASSGRVGSFYEHELELFAATPTEWGDALPNTKTKPAWLADDEIVKYGHAIGQASEFAWGGSYDTYHVRANHPFYVVQKNNAERGTNFTYWPGGDEAPADYDGGSVLLENTCIVERAIEPSTQWKAGKGMYSRVIGYTKKADAVAPAKAETVWGEPIVIDFRRPEWLKDGDTYLWSGSGESFSKYAETAPHSGYDIIHSIKLPADHFAYKAIAAGFTPWGGGEAAPADYDPVAGFLFRNGETQNGTGWNWRSPQGSVESTHDIIGYKRKAEAPAVEAAPTFKAGDRIRAIKSHPYFPLGYEATLYTDDFGDLCFKDSDGDAAEIEDFDGYFELDDLVRVKRMTEDEARTIADKFGGRLHTTTRQDIFDALKELGLIAEPKPETLEERFTRETGVAITPENSDAIKAALAWQH